MQESRLEAFNSDCAGLAGLPPVVWHPFGQLRLSTCRTTAKGWDDKLAVFSSEEQPPWSIYLQLYSPLLCTSCGYLWGSDSKSLSNSNCHRCRKVSKSSWLELCKAIGSHIGGGTGWRGRSVYPCEQRKVPNYDFFQKYSLKDILPKYFFFLDFKLSLLPNQQRTSHSDVYFIWAVCCLFSLLLYSRW